MKKIDELSKYYVWLSPPYGKSRKIEKGKSIHLDEYLKYIFLIDPFLLRKNNLFSQNTESSLEE